MGGRTKKFLDILKKKKYILLAGSITYFDRCSSNYQYIIKNKNKGEGIHSYRAISTVFVVCVCVYLYLFTYKQLVNT